MLQALRQLPAVHRWLRAAPAADLCAEFGRSEVVEVMRSHLDRIRDEAVLLRLQDIDGLNCMLQDDTSFAGGGSLPLSGIPSTAIRLHHETFAAAEIARRLRGGTTPVIGRIANDRLHLSLRTVPERETDDLVNATETALI